MLVSLSVPVYPLENFAEFWEGLAISRIISLPLVSAKNTALQRVVVSSIVPRMTCLDGCAGRRSSARVGIRFSTLVLGNGLKIGHDFGKRVLVAGLSQAAVAGLYLVLV